MSFNICRLGARGEGGRWEGEGGGGCSSTMISSFVGIVPDYLPSDQLKCVSSLHCQISRAAASEPLSTLLDCLLPPDDKECHLDDDIFSAGTQHHVVITISSNCNA